MGALINPASKLYLYLCDNEVMIRGEPCEEF